MARRVHARLNVLDGSARTQRRAVEATALHQVSLGVGRSVAEEVLSSVGGVGVEVHANMEWCRMAKPMGAWQRGRRAGRPARFEPQERTRIVEAARSGFF